MSHCDKIKQPCATPWQCNEKCRLGLDQDNSDASSQDSRARPMWMFAVCWVAIALICYAVFFGAAILAGFYS